MLKTYRYTIELEDEIDLDAILSERTYLVTVNGDKTFLIKGSPLNALKEPNDHLTLCFEYGIEFECSYIVTIKTTGGGTKTMLIKKQTVYPHLKETYGDDVVVLALLRVPNSKAVFS